MAKKEINLNDYQVMVEKPIWLSGQVWEPKLYDPSPAVLLQCAKELSSETNPCVYFAMNGVRVNPFAKFQIVDLNAPDEEEVDDEDLDNEEGTDGEADGDDGSDEEEVDEGFNFKTAEEFATLPKAEQLEYVESIRETPVEYDEELATKYEAELFDVVTSYQVVVTGANARKLIEEILSDYDN